MADAARVLDDVKGLRADARAALLDAYPTVADLATATEQDLRAVKGVGPAAARSIQAAVADALATEMSVDVTAETTPDEAVAVATAAPPPAAVEPSAGAPPAPREDATPAATAADEDVATAARRAVQDVAAGASESPQAALDAIRRQLENTGHELTGALQSLLGVVSSAVEAGKAELPDVTEELTKARAAVSGTVRSLLDAAKDLRNRS